jgi:hypothetical protein
MCYSPGESRTIPPQRTPRLGWLGKWEATGAESLAGTVRLRTGMSRIGHILSHPVKSFAKWWRAYTGSESNEDLIEREEVRLQCLRVAIALYNAKYGRLPAILRDLCDNNYNDPQWGGPFIPWTGEDTFRDSFGYRYEYEARTGRPTAFSVGLERAKSISAEPRAPPNDGPDVASDSPGASGGPSSVS